MTLPFFQVSRVAAVPQALVLLALVVGVVHPAPSKNVAPVKPLLGR